METLGLVEARRLALARAGLLKPGWTGLVTRAAGRGLRAQRAALAVVRRFGYLQLDTVSVAGARTHGIVLLSRIQGLDGSYPEELLRPGSPLFEYWGHEASWLPIELYPAFGFRRRGFSTHPWWGDLLGKYPEIADGLMRRVADEGPLRSVDLDGRAGTGMWEIKLAKKVASALWSRGDLAIRERRNFQRTFDLAERVIPDEFRGRDLSDEDAFDTLLLRALAGHGWAQTGTLAATWRLRNCKAELDASLARLVERGEVRPCVLAAGDRRRGDRPLQGWIRPADLELAARLRPIRPRRDVGVLLSPFDPVLWDRGRVKLLFDFELVIEIYKPAAERVYGYYCLPVLAGEHLVGRCDLKADRKARTLNVLSVHTEAAHEGATARRATRSALDRFADALGFELAGKLPS